MSDSPFDTGTSGSSRARVVAMVALVGAAVIAAWYFTRDAEAPTMAEDHAHAAPAGDGPGTMFTLDSAAARRIGVTYATVERGALSRQVRVAGRVVVDETRQSVVAPRIDGWIEELYVNTTGVAVEARAPLFALYSPMLVAAQEELVLAARLADEAAARGDTTGTAADLLRSARRRLEYWDVPADEIDRIIATRTTTRTLVLRAAHGGVVLEKNVVVGQQVMAGANAYTIAALDRVWIEGDVFEQDLAAARLGAAVDVESAAEPGRTRRGRIAFVSPVVQPETRTATVRVEVANADGRLKPGMLATLHLSVGSATSVVHVPRSAVLVTGTRALVFVLMDDGMLEPREVRLGVASDVHQQVVSGLVPGEVVVRSATFLVDAESNLRSALGGMAAMPGMDMSAPVKVPDEPHTH